MLVRARRPRWSGAPCARAAPVQTVPIGSQPDLTEAVRMIRATLLEAVEP